MGLVRDGNGEPWPQPPPSSGRSAGAPAWDLGLYWLGPALWPPKKEDPDPPRVVPVEVAHGQFHVRIVCRRGTRGSARGQTPRAAGPAPAGGSANSVNRVGLRARELRLSEHHDPNEAFPVNVPS